MVSVAKDISYNFPEWVIISKQYKDSASNIDFSFQAYKVVVLSQMLLGSSEFPFTYFSVLSKYIHSTTI